jgi:integrase
LNNGADITFIRDLAGHQDIGTTAKYYLRVNKDQLRQVILKHLNYELPDNTKSGQMPARNENLA